MPEITRQAIVPFSSKQMFSLVDDIESYPEFLPYCSGTKVINRNANEVTASLSISKGSFSQSFTTRNRNTPYSEINMSLVDGPFKYLNGSWRFIALSPTASKVELDIQFEFSNALLGLAFGKVFNQLIESFVDVFTQRARDIYSVQEGQ